MIHIFVFFWFLSSVYCEEKCRFLKPEGKYEGIRIYRKTDKELKTYYAYNKKGIQWELNVNQTNERMELIDGKSDNSIKGLNQYNQRVGVYYRNYVTKNSNYTSVSDICSVKYSEKSLICENINKVFNHTDISDNSLLINPWVQNVLNPYYVMIVDKSSGHTFYFNHRNGKFPDFCKLCTPLSFIGRLRNPLSEQLEGVINYGDGWVLLFNIKSKPMYCFQIGGNLTKNCASIESLTTFHEECFEKTSKYWVILIVVIVVIVLFVFVAIICILCVICKQNEETKPKFKGLKLPKKNTDDFDGNEKVITKEESVISAKSEFFEVKSDIDYTKPIPLNSKVTESESSIHSNIKSEKPKPLKIEIKEKVSEKIPTKQLKTKEVNTKNEQKKSSLKPNVSSKK